MIIVDTSSLFVTTDSDPQAVADQRIGVTDASLVVVAGRYRTRTICTLDRRHFSVLRCLDDREFTPIPQPCDALPGQR